ncbi:MAG: sulfite exporter TauE/SafE family protein [Candidatus Saganbacteria bacterium]|nr:sulfite exporter TauE/SafE family protein [Candidatus Saganbacteria bacterium]
MAGLISGLVGVGGGIVMVPAMVILLKMNQHETQGTSLFAIIPTAAVGAATYAVSGYLNVGVALWVAIGSFAGAYFGSSFANKISEKNLKIIYVLFLMVVGIKFLIK